MSKQEEKQKIGIKPEEIFYPITFTQLFSKFKL